MKYITCILTVVMLHALPFCALPAYAQPSPPVADAAPVADATTARPPTRVVLKSTSNASIAAYFVRQQRFKSTLLRASYVSDRPDSELPKTMRYALGGTLATAGAASFAGGIWLGVGTADAFRSDAHLSDMLGGLAALMSAGAIGFSITSGVWSVRLFRGKAVLRSPSH